MLPLISRVKSMQLDGHHEVIPFSTTNEKAGRIHGDIDTMKSRKPNACDLHFANRFWFLTVNVLDRFISKLMHVFIGRLLVLPKYGSNNAPMNGLNFLSAVEKCQILKKGIAI